jgi:hypothetical protein
MAKRPTTEPNADDALFARLKGWVRDSMEAHADWFKEAEECFGFVAGRSLDGKGQWPGDSWQKMIDSGRQPIEFNRVGPIVDAVCGLEVNNRQEIKYLPRTQGDTQTDERLSSLAEWARDEAHSEDEESEAFRNAVICGRGATETRLDFDEEPTGKFVDDSLDPLQCGVDPGAKKPCFADRRYSWRYRDLAVDQAKAMFPGLLPAALHASWAMPIDTTDGGEGNKTDYPDETRAGMKSNIPPKLVRIVQIEWWEPADIMLVATPDSEQPQEIDAEAWAELSEEEQAQLPAQRVARRRYRKAFLGGTTVLDQADIETFQIQWVTGRWDRNKGYHYGVVRPMRDPQMLSNKTLAQVLHILNTNAKGGLLIEAGAFKNPREAEKDWSNPSKSITLNDGGLAKIKERTAPQIPAALVQLQEFSLSSINDVTGANVEMLGLADREQPASLEYQRRQSAMTILAPLFNALRHYRKLKGKTLLSLLKLLPPGVLVRVLIDPEQAEAEHQQAMVQWSQQPEVQQYLALVQQAKAAGQQPPPPPPDLPPQPEPPDAQFMTNTKRGEQFDPTKFGLGPDARFDVIVDEAPSSPNQKDATWAAIQPFVSEIGAVPSAIPIMLKYSPLPETAAKELGDALSNAGAPDPKIAGMIQAGQQRISELEQQLKQAQDKSQADAIRANATAQDSDTRRFKAIADVGHGNTDHLLQAVQMLADHVARLNGGQANGG